MRLLIIFCIALIFALGLLMVFNTTSAEILDRSLDRNLHYALLKQIMYALIGLSLAWIIGKIGYENALRLSFPLLILCLIFLVLVFIPGIGQIRNGARRWIGVGSFTFQPSEFVKLIVPMCYIEYIAINKKIDFNFIAFLKIAGVLSIPLFLVMIEPDNGTAAVIGLSLLPLFFISKVKFKYWAMPCLVLLTIGLFAAYHLPYVRSRIQVYLNPELDLKGKGHQPHQAKIAAGSGKFLGRGPGASLQKLNYLPEAQNDYIAAIYAEEFGFVGIATLIILYMLFGYAGYTIAMQSQQKEASFLALSLTFLICLQAFLNLGVVSGLLPSKGVNLPFFSQGGTSLIANFIAVALLLNIAKRNEYEKEKANDSCRRHGRTSFPSPSSC